MWKWQKPTLWLKLKNHPQRNLRRKRRDPGLVKGRRTPGGTDLTTDLAPIPVHADDVLVPDRTPQEEDQVPEGEFLLDDGVLPDVVPLVPDTDTGAPQSAGGALALLHPLAAALPAHGHLKKQ